MTLTNVDIINGIFGLIVVAIDIFIGIKIISKYFKYKDKTLILVGATWILISELYWSPVISVLISIIIGGDGLYQYPEIYFFIGFTFIPLALALWLTAMGNFLWKNHQRIGFIIIIILNLLFEIVFLYFLFTAPKTIGTLKSPVDVKYGTLILLFVIVGVTAFVLSGILFARKSFLSDDPKIKLKGKFLIIAFVSWAISGVLDAVMDLNVIFLILMRILAITSAIEFYCGFVLPQRVADLFLKEKV